MIKCGGSKRAGLLWTMIKCGGSKRAGLLWTMIKCGGSKRAGLLWTDALTFHYLRHYRSNFDFTDMKVPKHNNYFPCDNYF